MSDFSVKMPVPAADRLPVERQRTPVSRSASSADTAANNRIYGREAPFATDRSEFVEADGRRYYLNAPRGTYLNILV